MRLDPAFKIEKACSADKSRPVLTSCYLDAEASVLVATDSYQLAVVPVEVEDGDVSGLVPAAALSAWRKASTRSIPAGLSANGSVEVRGSEQSASFPRPDGQFPDYGRLCQPPAPNVEGDGAGFFPASLKPIVVHNGGHGEVGLVMPIRQAV